MNPPLTNPNRSASFEFERFGRTYHLKIESARDLAAILAMDEAHWVATTAPLATINCDPVFLQYMDTDNDGRLRAEEIKDAIRFLMDNLADLSGVTPGNTRLPLKAINTGNDIGQRVRTSAEKILQRNASEENQVTLEEIRRIKSEVQNGGLDEAGIVLPEAAESPAVRQFIQDILATVGGKPHHGGSQGIDQEALEKFLAQSRQYLAWHQQAAPADGSRTSPILPLGEATPEAYALFSELKNKIAQFFLLCNIRQLNPDLLVKAVSSKDGTLGINVLDLSAAEAYLADAPLSMPNNERVLDLTGNVNPYFRRKVQRFADIAIKPLLGQTALKLDRSAWRQLNERFTAYQDWLAAKPDVCVAKVKVADLENYVSQADYAQRVRTLIEKSYRTAFVLDNICQLERLVLYQAHLLTFANSFVSFPHLYDPGRRALFEMGTLVMDGRHFTLAVKVLDRERHVRSSTASNIFIMYVEVYGHNGEQLYEVAVPITAGNRGTIRVNKWGIFNDVNGEEWHAKIVHVIENPISVSEAMFLPFVRVAQSFMARLEAFSIRAEEKLGLRTAAKADKQKKGGDKKEKKESGPSAGLLAGGGVALAALGSSVAFIAQTVSKLSPKIVLGSILAVILLVLLPAAVSTYYKLSKRDLSAILEGSGWGVNARMKLTQNQARTFTHRPAYPRSGGKKRLAPED